MGLVVFLVRYRNSYSLDKNRFYERFAFACYDFLDNLKDIGEVERFKGQYGEGLFNVVEDCAKRHLKVGEFEVNGEREFVDKFLEGKSGKYKRFEREFRGYLLFAIVERRARFNKPGK